MTRDELVARLEEIRALEGEERPGGDEADWHRAADRALLEHIDDAEVTAAFRAISKWYE